MTAEARKEKACMWGLATAYACLFLGATSPSLSPTNRDIRMTTNILFFQPLRPSVLDRALSTMNSVEYYAALGLLKTVVPELGASGNWFLEEVSFPPYEEYRLGPAKPPRRRLAGVPLPKPREFKMPVERNPNDEMRISYWHGTEWDYAAFAKAQWDEALQRCITTS